MSADAFDNASLGMRCSIVSGPSMLRASRTRRQFITFAHSIQTGPCYAAGFRSDLCRLGVILSRKPSELQPAL
jgi:hypothetical protein